MMTIARRWQSTICVLPLKIVLKSHRPKASRSYQDWRTSMASLQIAKWTATSVTQMMMDAPILISAPRFSHTIQQAKVMFLAVPSLTMCLQRVVWCHSRMQATVVKVHRAP